MIYKSSNAFSFGKSKRSDSKFLNRTMTSNPPVGKYTKDILSHPEGGFHFAKEPKLKALRPKTPGPGKYNPEQSTRSNIRNAPKYSLYNADKHTQIDKIVNKSKKMAAPGPGSHNITNENLEHTIKKTTISRKFAQEEKLKLKDNKVPGVWKYNPKTNKEFGKSDKNKFTISKTTRKSIVDNSKTSSSIRHKDDIKALDPGHYTIQPKFGNEGMKVTIRGKPKERKRMNTPGPAHYKRVEEAKKNTLRKAPASGIGYGNRTDIIAREKKKNVPGAKYDIKSGFDVSDKSKIKTFTFSKDERMKKVKNTNPGPGKYHLPCSFAVTPDYQGVENKYRKI